MFPWLKLAEYVGIFAAGAVAATLGCRMYYLADIAEIKGKHAEEVSIALADTAREQVKQRQIESQAAQAARRIEDEHQARTKLLEARNLALADAGNLLRNKYSMLAKQASRTSTYPAPAGQPDDQASACWTILGRTDELAERRTKDAEGFAEQVRGLQAYVDSLAQFR